MKREFVIESMRTDMMRRHSAARIGFDVFCYILSDVCYNNESKKVIHVKIYYVILYLTDKDIQLDFCD